MGGGVDAAPDAWVGGEINANGQALQHQEMLRGINGLAGQMMEGLVFAADLNPIEQGRQIVQGTSVRGKSLSPLLRGKNRIQGFCAEDAPHLQEALQFFRKDKLHCSLGVPYGEMTQDLFFQLCAERLWSSGSGTVPCVVPDSSYEQTASPALPLQIHESGEDEKELYLDLFRQAFAERGEGHAEYLHFQWTEDTLPECRRYIAESEGVPVAMASFPIIDGVGFFGTAGVIPAWRGRGIQAALLRRRIADAPRFGCDLVIGGGSLFSTTHRNFERAGLHLIPTGSSWRDRAD